MKVPKDNFLKNYFHTFFVNKEVSSRSACVGVWMMLLLLARLFFIFFSSLRTRRARGTHAANRAMGELKRSA